MLSSFKNFSELEKLLPHRSIINAVKVSALNSRTLSQRKHQTFLRSSPPPTRRDTRHREPFLSNASLLVEQFGFKLPPRKFTASANRESQIYDQPNFINCNKHKTKANKKVFSFAEGRKISAFIFAPQTAKKKKKKPKTHTAWQSLSGKVTRNKINAINLNEL